MVSSTVQVTTNTFTMSLPALSTTALLLKGTAIITDVEEMEHTAHVKLFPNPSSENTWIDISEEKILDLKVEVYSVQGTLVYSNVYSGNHASLIEIPSAQFAQGLYVVKLSTASKKIWTGKLLKM